jgi:hypothetical protein
MKDFDKLNRETYNYNNIGNQHHYTNTGIKHPTNFEKLNTQTYYENNYKCNFYK